MKREERLFAMQHHVRPEIQKLIDRGNVTSAELKELRCNSWEWQALVPAMTNEALLDRTRHALDNSTPPRRPASTYDEAVIGVFAPVLMERLAKATAEAFRHQEAIRRLSAKCTCDDFCDGVCPQHGRENALQNRALAAEGVLRAVALSLRNIRRNTNLDDAPEVEEILREIEAHMEGL